MFKTTNKPTLVARIHKGKKGTPGFMLWYTKVYRYHGETKTRTLKVFTTAAGVIRNNINTLKRLAKDYKVVNEPTIKVDQHGARPVAILNHQQWANRFKIPFSNELQ